MKNRRKIERPLEGNMRHFDKVLREKENAIERIRREIEALRLVCPLLHEESDAAASDVESDKREEKTDVVVLADENKDALARIRERLVDRRSDSQKEGKNFLLQFGQVALGASRTFLKRFLDSHFLEREPQQKTIRDLFEWLGRSNAA